MLIKDEIENMLLLQLNKPKESVATFTIYWDNKIDRFHGLIFFYELPTHFEYIVNLENHQIYLLSIKEINYNISEKVVYSIDGIK